MKHRFLIAHRGNHKGRNPDRENDPKYIVELPYGYSPEIDIWSIGGKFYFGHDEPKYEIPPTYNLYTRDPWYHCKNLEALQRLYWRYGVHYFWHENDHYTITNRGFIWTTDLNANTDQTVLMVVNPSDLDLAMKNDRVAGICCDVLP